MQQFIDRIDRMASAGPLWVWTCLAIFFAAALGFELASYRYQHGDAAQLVLATALLLVSASHLFGSRWVRVSLHFISMPLLVLALIMLAVSAR